ncbi:MAG: CYTH domain-containing protein [Vicingaceae bacterium]|nr:CYTH domain-containing protein [Vicingaceae bacterium]
MGLEIERKFLLKNDDWKLLVKEEISIKQGYLNSEKERTVRVRTYGNKGVITIKGKSNNLTRKEFEYTIPLADALEMLALAEQPIIEKTRFIVLHKNNTWEIDVFEGVNKGLTVTEIELQSETQQFEIPEWIAQEVSTDPKYYNANLIANPFKDWN